MPINLTEGQRYDTRGLPEGYDPHKLYEYRLDTAIKNSSGLESFLYKIMPVGLVKSFAFAVDPTARYKVSSSPITPANRTRIRANQSVLNTQAKFSSQRIWSSWSQQSNYKGVAFCSSPFYEFTGQADPPNVDYFTVQSILADRIKDTTKRTRLFGSSQGTLEFFKGFVYSPTRTNRIQVVYREIHSSDGSVDPTCRANGGTFSVGRGTNETYRYEQAPYGATLSVNAHNQLRDGEINFAKNLCQKHLPSMLKSVEPFAGDYTLFRNLVELRDIPRSVAQLQQTAQDLRKVYLSLRHSPKIRKVVFNLKSLGRDIPNEYLSYHFGWKQLWRDINDLLTLPEKTTKKVNFLLARSGKPTTFRSKRIVPSTSVSGVSGFDYRQTAAEWYQSSATRIERNSEVRLVVNRTFDFPPVNSVDFKRHIFAERTGLQPRITDVYNLVPWTWLLDWFTGLGNYIDLIETINGRDSGIVNWGMISCVTTGRLITDYQWQSPSYYTMKAPTGNTESTSWIPGKHTSVFSYECHTRNDVATILDLNLTSVPSTLTAYQMSILGALLAQRAKFRF